MQFLQTVSYIHTIVNMEIYKELCTYTLNFASLVLSWNFISILVSINYFLLFTFIFI